MVDRVLIDTLKLQAGDFSIRWKDQIRKSPQLKHYNGMTDQELIELGIPLYPLLARTLDRGIDRSMVGEFFVGIGKERAKMSFPVSEIIYGVNLAQQVVMKFLMTDFILDSSVRMYEVMGAVNRVSEFFLLGCFYITKGFLETTYLKMNKHDEVSEELLKKYFKDDFFFKDGN